jgi:hypothetical protein
MVSCTGMIMRSVQSIVISTDTKTRHMSESVRDTDKIVRTTETTVRYTNTMVSFVDTIYYNDLKYYLRSL